MRSWKLWPLILLYPAICIGAYLYCESQSFPACESKQHRAGEAQQQGNKPEVALSLILLAENEQPRQAESVQRAIQPTQHCPVICRIITRTLDEPVALFTGVLCFVLFLQLIWMTRQDRILSKYVAVAERAAEAANKSAHVAEAASIATQRADVSPRCMVTAIRDETDTIREWEFAIQWENSGQIPAYRARFGCSLVIGASPPDTFSLKAHIKPVVLGRGKAHVTLAKPQLTHEQANQIGDGALVAYLCGLAEYSDALAPEPPVRHITLCMKICVDDLTLTSPAAFRFETHSYAAT